MPLEAHRTRTRLIRSLLAMVIGLAGSTELLGQPQRTNRSVSGRLFEYTTGEPLGGRTLHVWRFDAWSLGFGPAEITVGETDEDGRFRLESLENVILLIDIQDRWYTEKIRVSRRGDVDLGDIRVPPCGILRGRLVDSEGQPVAGGQATVVRMEIPGDSLPPEVMRSRIGCRPPSGVSDEEGYFEIAGLADGKYTLVGGATGFATSEESEPFETQRAKVTEGPTLTLQAGDVVLIQGRVTDAAGLPVEGAEISVGSDRIAVPEVEGRTLIFTTPYDTASRTDAAGRYEIRVPEAGASRVNMLTCALSGRHAVRMGLPRLVVGGPNEVDVELSRGAIRFWYLNEDGEKQVPKGGGLIHLIRGSHRHPGRLTNNHDTGVSRGIPSGGLIESLESGVYTLVTAQEIGFVSEPIEVHPNETTDVVLSFPADRPSLKIRVLDSEEMPLPEASVSLQLPAWGASMSGRTDSDGRLEKRSVPPGEYFANVSDRSRGILLNGYPVTVAAEPAEQEIMLRVPKAMPTVACRLMQGQVPVADAEVSLTLLASRQRLHAQTDSKGILEVRGLPPGLVEIEVPGRLPFRVEIPGMTGDAPLVIRVPAGEVSGQIAEAFRQGRASVSLTRHADSLPWERAPTVRLDEAGRFRFEGLPAGNYRLYLMSPDEGGLKLHALSDLALEVDQTLTLGELAPESAERFGGLAYTMRHVTGPSVMQEGTFPLLQTADGFVLPERSYHPFGSSPSAKTRALALLPIGKYRFHLVSEHYSAPPVDVAIRAGETADVSIPLGAGGALTVRAQNASAEPLPSVEVMLLDGQGRSVPFPMLARPHRGANVTGSSGALYLQHVHPGRYRLRLSRGDRVVTTELFEVKDGQMTERVVTLD